MQRASSESPAGRGARTHMLSATCHCGAVRDVRITSEPGATESYAWGDKRLRFVRCATCGCVVNWERLSEHEKGRVGVNARNFDPDLPGRVRIRRLDGATAWRHLRDDE